MIDATNDWRTDSLMPTRAPDMAYNSRTRVCTFSAATPTGSKRSSKATSRRLAHRSIDSDKRRTSASLTLVLLHVRSLTLDISHNARERERTLQLIVACMYAAKEKQLGSMLKEAIKEDPLHPVFQYGIFFGSNRRYPSDFGKVRASYSTTTTTTTTTMSQCTLQGSSQSNPNQTGAFQAGELLPSTR